MKKRIAVIVFAIAALAAVPLVFAQGGGRGPGQGQGPGGFGMHGDHRMGMGGIGFLGPLMHMKGELGLTDSQSSQIQTILTTAHEQNAQYRDQMQATFKQVAQTLLANPNDVAGAQALLDQQAATERVMKTNMLNAASKALNVLTAEQRTKLATLLAERAQRWQNRGK